MNFLKFNILLFIFYASQVCFGQQEQLALDLTAFEFERVHIAQDDGLQSWENIDRFYEDEEGIIWTSIQDGVFRFNGHSALNVTKYLTDNYGLDLGDQHTTRFFVERDQTIWYGTRRGLYKIDSKNFKASKIHLDEALLPPNYRNFILEIDVKNDTVYVGTANGLYLIDKHSEKLISKHFTNGKEIKHRESTQAVQSIFLNVEKDIAWVSLMNGLYKLNVKNGAFERFKVQPMWPDTLAHNFEKGFLHKNKLMLSEYSIGMVSFDLNSKEFDRYPTKRKTGNERFYNITRSSLKINDSLALVNIVKLGNALFNLNTKTYTWLETPEILKEGVFLSMDRSGYVWASKRGQIFRTKRSVTNTHKPFKHILDISAFKANNILIKRPSIEGYSEIQLKENDNNIELDFSVSKAYILEDVSYQYQLNSDEWQPISGNILKLDRLNTGYHNLKLRAVNSDNSVLANRVLKFNIFLPFYKSTYFIALLLAMLLTAIYFLGMYHNSQKQKEERLKAQYELQLTKLESEALRSQINPHFIFNTLNSIKFYTLKRSKEETVTFINEFSTLIRQILETSKLPLVNLEDEIKTIKAYIEIEKKRFNDGFSYDINIDDSVDKHFVMAPMIIQPFIENAIWHGLMHKEEDRLLSINFKQQDTILTCEIIDNGIGRLAAKEITKSKPHKSGLGITITQTRLEKLETLYNIKSHFEIIDLFENEKAIGTKVIITFKKTGND